MKYFFTNCNLFWYNIDIRKREGTEPPKFREELIMFYAEYCCYGLATISDADRVMRFETREERDEMVERLNEANYETIEGVCAPPSPAKRHPGATAFRTSTTA